MPKRTDIETILIIGAGPIVIAKPANLTIQEHRLQGTKRRRLQSHPGDSNPATIMTDPEFADVTYIEPLT